MKNIKTTCLCGETKIEVESLPKVIGACHCTSCRKWGGGPFLSMESKDKVSFEPQSNVKVFNSSDWAERGFCKECGTHLFYRVKQNQHYFFPVGLFAHLSDLTFEHQIFIDEKPNYYNFKEQTSNMTGAEVFAMFAASKKSD